MGPRGPTSRDERERRGKEREKRPKRAVQTHSIHTRRQTKTNATCKHTVSYYILVRTPLSRARGIQRRYSPQEGTVHRQVSHNRVTQHSTDSNTRPLSASHWSGVSRDTVFTNTPTTQVCRLLLLTTGLRWCRITSRLLYLHLLRGGTVEDVSPLVGAKTTSSHRLPVVALLGCSGSGRGRGGEGGSVTGKSLQVRQLLDLINPQLTKHDAFVQLSSSVECGVGRRSASSADAPLECTTSDAFSPRTVLTENICRCVLHILQHFPTIMAFLTTSTITLSCLDSAPLQAESW